MIYTNEKMAQLLNTTSFDRIAEQEFDSISNIISPIFVDVDDCVLLKNKNEDIKPLDMNMICKFYGDRTGFEAFYNHIHTSQYIDDDNKGPIEGFKLAKYILDAWKTKLKIEFPENKFHLILSYDGKESTLRFHKYRQDEGSYLVIDDLDGYKGEAILVEEI